MDYQMNFKSLPFGCAGDGDDAATAFTKCACKFEITGGSEWIIFKS